ncbi:hypothetical protein Msil_3114 [Methylocella silvestris BL2]|uniref:Uncharacterized protein n=1 Tax=Methylocella silvestris (strain DSM 15510 / CIP 108128 / LMG 27833 / NCIMB 13906 / BL2) TaxID=395965 RepID=B8EKZ5_METSB|nr:hypothetical protein [Methylocella silvestris]ACK52023.1 hypothetical protein Msil_3114 [Methylocella silvestris BL2]
MTKKQSNATPIEALADLRRKIRREGAEEAFAALREICNNPKAPAPAKATAATSIFRAAGLFDKTEGTADDKPLSEMTAAELDQIIRRGQMSPDASAPKAKRRKSRDAPPIDVFE